MKRQRKELAIAKRKTVRVKEKEKMAITPKAFFTKLHADKAKRDGKSQQATSSSTATKSEASKWSVLSENFLIDQADKLDETNDDDNDNE